MLGVDGKVSIDSHNVPVLKKKLPENKQNLKDPVGQRVKGKVTNATLHFADNNGLLAARSIEDVTDIMELSRVNLKNSNEELILEVNKIIDELTRYESFYTFIPYCVRTKEVSDKILLRRREEFFLYEAITQLQDIEEEEEKPVDNMAITDFFTILPPGERERYKKQDQLIIRKTAKSLKQGFLAEIEDDVFKSILDTIKNFTPTEIQDALSTIYIQCYLAVEIPKVMNKICAKVPEWKNEHFSTMTDIEIFLHLKTENIDLIQANNAFDKMFYELREKNYFNNFNQLKDWLNNIAPKVSNDFEKYCTEVDEVNINFRSGIIQKMKLIEKTFNIKPIWGEYIDKFKAGKILCDKAGKAKICSEITIVIQKELSELGKLDSPIGTNKILSPIVNRVNESKPEDPDIAKMKKVVAYIEAQGMMRSDSKFQSLIDKIKNNSFHENEKDKKLAKLVHDSLSQEQIEEFFRQRSRNRFRRPQKNESSQKPQQQQKVPTPKSQTKETVYASDTTQY